MGPDAERAGWGVGSFLNVFANADQAKSFYTANTPGKDSVTGPKVAADDWSYSEATVPGPTPNIPTLTTLSLRWRIGTSFGRISLTDRQLYGWRAWTPATLASLFVPVAQRTRQLLAGHLHGSRLSASQLSLLPPSGAAPGSVTGTAVVPAQEWATVASGGDPQGTLSTLEHGGVSTLLLRGYLVRGIPGHTVSAVLMHFSSPVKAGAWVRGFISEAQRAGPLSPGRTGSESAFTSYGGKFYELQFARGSYVGDVGCQSLFATTSPSCEGITRALAERWYATLG